MSRLNIEQACRYQKVVLWTRAGYGADGRATLNSPIQLTVRYIQNKDEILGPEGTPIATEADMVVDREIAVGSIVWLGKLADLPGTPTNLKEVVAYLESPDIKNRYTRRKVTLAKYSNKLPTLA